MSYVEGYLARAVGLALLGFMLEQMNVSIDEVRVYETQSTVLHCEFELNTVRHARWSTTTGPVVDEATVAVVKERAMELRDALLAKFARVKMP